MVKCLIWIGIKRNFPMNMPKIYLLPLLIGLVIYLEPIMASMSNKNITSAEFVQFVKERKKSGDVTLDNFEIKGFAFPFKEIRSVHFKAVKWDSIDAQGRQFVKVVFEDCELNNLNFREVVLQDVTFRNCTLTNVVMNGARINKVIFEKSKLISTDSNIEHSYRNLVADTLLFRESELKNINFFKSRGKFHFEGGKLVDVSGMGLTVGSALYFTDVNAVDIDFSDSSLSTLVVKNSVIKESKANNCHIGSVVLENSDLKFPISDGKGYDRVTAINTKNVVIGGTPVKEVSITGCGESNVIEIAGMTFDKMVVDGCSPLDFVVHKSKGKNLTIMNATVVMLDLKAIDVDSLILKNINIRKKLYYKDAKVKNIEYKNIHFTSENIKVKSEGANFEIKADVSASAE